MPPKGWKKDAQGNYPTTSYMKEQESVTIHDLLFPKSVVTQLAKEVGGDSEKKLLVSKDTALALQRSSTVFVNHLFMFAREIALSQDRKSCNINDIYDALDQTGFGGFKSIINSKIVAYQEALEMRKKFKSNEKTTSMEENGSEDEEQQEEQQQDGTSSDEQGISKRPKT
ncbi:hypothetical protein HG537_0H01800 [Torulaspora globosa]|uniref:DNA polymerase epsilon subunit D n=1 Tax=Torulaspora globosa TaxID=48254 RepID=A0A7H9HXG3_9SACH|nr:hypothetical protein HG537_0H01800 [Torulaspora sp. CBS 2947]